MRINAEYCYEKAKEEILAGVTEEAVGHLGALYEELIRLQALVETYSTFALPTLQVNSSDPEQALHEMLQFKTRYWEHHNLTVEEVGLAGYWLMSQTTFNNLSRSVQIDRETVPTLLQAGILGYLWGWTIYKIVATHNSVFFLIDPAYSNYFDR